MAEEQAVEGIKESLLRRLGEAGKIKDITNLTEEDNRLLDAVIEATKESGEWARRERIL
jgi:hypothetical protein